MGTILQERAPQQHAERVSIIRDRKNNTPNVASSRMGRRQAQRKPVQPQYMLPSQENINEKRLQQRRKQKPNPPSTKRATSHHRTQGSSESKTHPPSPTEDRSSQHKEHSGVTTSRHSAAFPCHNLSKTSPDLLETPSEVGVLSVDGDSDIDLSESERLPVGSFSRVPPQLHLRPEVIEAEDLSSRCQRPRGHGLGAFDFPDFLPPPFNSWSLSHLAVFYNTEGRGAPRPRAVGPLERYLERLLQLEWRKIQTVEEEGGNSGDLSSSCHKSPASSSSRLSSPKCILQCQRSFPLTFLSSLANHSALLSGCACTICRIRYSACSTSCCRSTSRIPRRSHSESRIPSSDRISRNPRFSSPLRNSHMKRMQASGNLRNPVQGDDECPSTSEENRVTEVLDYRTTGGGVGRRRSGSAQRRGGGEERLEKRRSGSEVRRGGEERLELRRSGSECRIGGEERLEKRLEERLEKIRSGSECRIGGEERLEKRRSGSECRIGGEERLEKRRSGSECRIGGEERLEKRRSGSECRIGGEERLEKRRSGSECRIGGEERLEKRLEERLEKRLEKRLEERLEKRRSGSECRIGGEERLEKRRSGSEVRRGGAGLKDREIKPDAVAAIMDNLPGFKKSPASRQKQVDFVT
ncbi:uncharacterized protein LOC117475367 [Trematomus bernacchii]|uniref:uncharacterized protein LOC117475367 n=1 Tax=Trematomus bernacchii TaxID=40690 RepID=UPI00146E463F|nr:uncharacterized protein LOC117475367 [Trematomus bernacchii]